MGVDSEKQQININYHWTYFNLEIKVSGEYILFPSIMASSSSFFMEELIETVSKIQ